MAYQPRSLLSSLVALAPALVACGSGGAVAPDASSPPDATASDSGVDARIVDGGNEGSIDAADDVVAPIDSGPGGDLDLSFAGTGYFTKTGSAGASAGNDLAHGVAVDSKGRIVVAGRSLNAIGKYEVATWRFTGAGALDPTFGTGGLWTANTTVGPGVYAEGWSVAVDAQDHVRVSGQGNNSTPIYATVWGLDDTGALETGFGASGLFSTTNAALAGYDLGRRLRLDKTGLLMTGTSNAPGFATDMAAWKITTAGALDTTFANPNGFVISGGAAGASPNVDAGSSIIRDALGNVLVVGYSRTTVGLNTVATLFRYKSTGALDATFGTAGHVFLTGLAGGTSDVASDVVLDAQGRIVISGTSKNSTGQNRAYVARLSSAGVLDATYGAGGVRILEPAPGGSAASASLANALALDANGRAVMVGYSNDGTILSAAAWRVDGNGALDPQWGTQGIFTKVGSAGALGSTAQDIVWDVALDAQSRAVMVGSSKDAAGHFAMAVWRLTP